VTVRTLPVTRPALPARSGRLDFLDALRGIAVCLVLVQHIGELTFPAIARFSMQEVSLGQLGVMVFFLCSGFIIPASLERGAATGSWAALAAFWRSRVFRLYPLYWVSLAAAAILVFAGLHSPASPLTPGDWLANASMFQVLVGSPHALGLYWTLAFEMFFYLALSGLFLLGWHRHSAALSLAASAGCVVAAVTAAPLLGRAAPLGLFCLAAMFTGTVFARWHAGTVRLRTLVLCVGTALAAGTVLATAAAPAVLPMLSSWFAAYAIFCTAVALRGRSVPAWLRRLGTISYSVYLMQALVLLAVPAMPHPVLSAAVWVAVTVAVSELTYRYVERPAVRLGRNLDLRRGPGADTPVADLSIARLRHARRIALATAGSAVDSSPAMLGRTSYSQ
jgi:peptidoglycan/LPS O-acetylase OafA/YrhL